MKTIRLKEVSSVETAIFAAETLLAKPEKADFAVQLVGGPRFFFKYKDRAENARRIVREKADAS